ncbi:phosphatase PAP2 family protein [Jongsikchunia kroppenstedtii]|uniref:phosphatase PAP2 family protein n=1 Tax=Jongsikchunia kroppenstedtii TaxID=1121721 RepID=UPI0003A713ED|nr:phosphatase PAP2 family protein [Jongsikchunia kroppenstedtii]
MSPDQSVLDWVVDHRESTLTSIMRAVTDCGRTIPLAVIVLIVVVPLLVFRRPGQAAMVGIGSLAGYWIMVGLKDITARARPPAADALVHESSWSFPSGHAMMSAIVLGLVAVTVFWNTGWHWALWIAALASVLIGLSRIYLAAHWLSDVLAGWVIGIAWVMLMARVFRRCRDEGGGTT